MKGLEIAHSADTGNMSQEELKEHIKWLEGRIRYCNHRDWLHTADQYEVMLSEAKLKLE